MRHEVDVRFSANEDLTLHCAEPLGLEEARKWLDQEFLRLECEPARASGKILFADKILAVTEAAGPQGFSDAAWAEHFARAVIGALGRSPVRVDLENAHLG